MRAASILFLALLATTAHADPRNKLVPGTDILLVDYGKVADPWAEEGTMYVQLALKDGNRVKHINTALRCKSRQFEVDREKVVSDWTRHQHGCGTGDDLRQKWWHF